MDKAQRVLVAFQGGGARGIAHIGALRALEEWTLAGESQSDVELRPEIAGVAGTSAGAIIAALVAARYSANDIFDTEKQEHLLMRVSEGVYAKPKDLFSEKGWSRIARVRRIAEWCHSYPLALRWGPLLIALMLLVWWIIPIGNLLWWTKLAIAGVCIWIIASVWSYLQGMADLAIVRSVVDEVIANADLPGELPDKNVTFAQLAEAGGLPLKIVSTNITSRTMEVFSSLHTPDVTIADAVCASICLPLVFAPYSINLPHAASASKFLDGGMLSNLPLWSFDEERASDPGAWTLGFSLTHPTLAPRSAEVGHWIGAVIDTIVSGPSQIHARAMPGLMIVPTPTSLRLLDFDVSFDKFANEIALAKQGCLDAMVEGAAEPLVKEHLERLRTTLVGHFIDLQKQTATSGAERVTEDELSFRLSIGIQRPSNPSVLYPRFQTGYDGSDLEARAKPLSGLTRVGGRWTLDLPLAQLPDPEAVSAGLENWLLPDSCWLVGFELPTGRDQAGEKLAPVLLIESATLTIDRLATTLGAEGDLSTVVDVIGLVVEQFDQTLELGQRAVRTQLWK